jgi:excisionase family DNA binding protein
MRQTGSDPVSRSTTTAVKERKRRNQDALGELRPLVSSTEAQSRLLTTTEAAEFLRVDRRTVVNWIERGVVPYVELPGRSGGRHRYRIPLEGLLDSLGGNYDLTAELEAL